MEGLNKTTKYLFKYSPCFGRGSNRVYLEYKPEELLNDIRCSAVGGG
jgi:hypothetical protein